MPEPTPEPTPEPMREPTREPTREPSLAVTINGERMRIPEHLSVEGLLIHLKVSLRHVAVERNTQLVPKTEFQTMRVEAGDRFEIVSLVGGG